MKQTSGYLRSWKVWIGVVIGILACVPGWCGDKKEILVGANLSLSGPLSLDGAEQVWAYKEAVKDVNAKGGIYVKQYGKKLPVRLVVADDESDPGKAAAAVESLIKLQGVDLLLSTHSTPLIIPSCITAEKYKKYYHATTALIPVWAKQKFQWSTLFFFDMHKFAEHPFEIWDSFPEDQRIKRPAMLMEDTLDGRGLGGGLRAMAKEHGYEFVVDEPWAVGAKDYSSQILKLRMKKVDALFLFGSPADSITFVRQMKEAGLSVRYLHGFKGTWTPEFSKALGDDAQYVLCDGFWSESFSYPGAQELGQRFRKRFHKASVSTGLFYATAQILWSAIEKAGTLDSAKVREAVLNNEFKGTVMGDVDYNEAGVARFVATANQWWDGEQKLVYPFTETTWQVKLAPPWDER